MYPARQSGKRGRGKVRGYVCFGAGAGQDGAGRERGTMDSRAGNKQLCP